MHLALEFKDRLSRGQDNASAFCIGFQASSLLCLDPHVLQPALLHVRVSRHSLRVGASHICCVYKDVRATCCTDTLSVIPLQQMDPNALMAFLFQTPEAAYQFYANHVHVREHK